LLHRSLDVIFQWLPGLVVVLLVPPVVTASLVLGLDQSQVVTTRVWADRPISTPDFTPNQFSPSDSPAQTEAAMVQELISTDTFTGQVLTKVEPQSSNWSSEHQDQAILSIRKGLSVTAQGTHLFVISYQTVHPEYGKAVLKAVTEVFGATLVQLQSNQVSSAQTSFQAELNLSKQEMNTAVAAAESYRILHQLDFQAASSDPNYTTLLAQARAKMDRYLSDLARADSAQASQVAVVSVQASLFHVIDQPSPVPGSITLSSPAFRGALVVLAINAAMAVLAVYVIARRDPRLRSIEDVRRDVGLRPLGSVRAVTSR
jgi:uncharacterized protein involved in exopolysaccharide biosynthesis